MPLRSGRLLKFPRESSTTVLSKNQNEPKKKKQGTTPVEPASAVSPVRSRLQLTFTLRLGMKLQLSIQCKVAVEHTV
ncbi:hypothetical protein RvY_15689 [Ramazzottius varieornatus]|uniref:Uncharacterized protein n=1 Tax=Ramazzottius varieornatus TaxID=947166 RepID=A0A1D1VVU5_RAMVA|nr:hypothetical protein RvY_15689 [Ramazzottius varieornatus]